MRTQRFARTIIVVVAAAVLAVGGFFAGQATASQPHMNAALNHLSMALTQLQQADPDKGGHRDNAIGLVKQAISQVNLGINYAATH